MSMERVCDQGAERNRLWMVIGGLSTAAAGLWALCSTLLSQQPASGGWRSRLAAVGIAALVGGTQFAAHYGLPHSPSQRLFIAHGDPGTRREFALRATEPYFRRALCTAISVAVATIFAVRWVSLRYGCPNDAYFAAAIPFVAAVVTSTLRVAKMARRY